MADARILVPIEESSTLRSTVAHVTSEAAEDGIEAIHFVYLASWRADEPSAARRRSAAADLLEEAALWARYDLEDVDAEDIAVETAIVGEDIYLFGPGEFADQLHRYADTHGIDTVILDPEYTPVGNTTLLQPMEFELASTPLSVRQAPVDRPARHVRIAKELTGVRFVAIFGISFVFYMILGDPTYWFDLLTGVASALIVAISLSRVSLDHDPTFPDTPMRLLRGIIYVPALFYEILISNLMVARVILSPSLPIDPAMTRMRVLVGSGLPVTTLANSITLTPGTLTVRARNENLYVHTLIPWAREGLFDGGLERWTRFVFYGREAARLPTPRERDDCAVLQGPEADEAMPFDEGERSMRSAEIPIEPKRPIDNGEDSDR
ncbi:monovalent cation/H+ antiporter subunit E [Halopenitus sp. H-Gu1]|uniref:monovalent cation/H+ antiporter subunit E n=1 Tax=Halopenitus sp. H-Gu1 TaxID=3242697 RepID=UPI00359E2C02